MKDVDAFTKAFANSKGNNQKVINDFVKKMQQYGITVRVSQ